MYIDKRISLKEEQQSTLCSAVLVTHGQLRDSSELFTSWETMKYSMLIDNPAFSISFWPSLAAQITGAFQWPVEYTGFLQLPGCTCQVHSAGQINSSNCCIYGARLMLQSALCHTEPFHCCTWTGANPLLQLTPGAWNVSETLWAPSWVLCFNLAGS